MSAGAPVQRAQRQRRYLTGIFTDLCRIESPSGRERACAERVMAELAEIGVQASEDDAGPRVGGDCGNLLARIPGSNGGPRELSVCLCAHLDTVPLAAPVEPVLVEGGFENANAGILGADNKAAVAVLLALARHVRAEGAPVDLELLFTVGEEVSLAGSLAFAASSLRSDFGFVFDHASPLGEVVLDSPSHFRVQASFRGAAAHAGIRPEEGRSAILAAARAIAAMPHGRLDPQTTVNVGEIAGGSAINVVPEVCTLVGEVRSLQETRAQEVLAQILDCVHDAANDPESECDVECSVQRTFQGYRLSRGSPEVAVALEALRACGFEPQAIASGGGSDANALIAHGFPTVNIANGTERNHEPGERVSVAALEGALEVALALLSAAEPSTDTAR